MNRWGTTLTHVEMTPATARFVEAVERSDWASVLRLLDEHWVEIWFAIDPADMRRLSAAVPPHLIRSHPNAKFIARATGHGPVDDLLHLPPAPASDATPAELAQYIADLRIRCRPVHAMAYVHRALAGLKAQRGQPLDSSGGTTAMWLVQAAITAMLAGETSTATGILLTATHVHRPDRFPFIVREATAKLALTYAIIGDITEAIAVNDRARGLPRSESWVESLVDETIRLTDYICAVDTFASRAESMRQQNPSPMAHGEFWPIALTTQVRHLVLTGRSHQAAKLCDSLEAAGVPPTDADGLFSSALPDARLSIRRQGAHDRSVSGASTAQSQFSRALHLLTTGQFPAVVRVRLPETYDERLVRAMNLVQAHSILAKGRLQEGRRLTLTTLQEVIDRRTYSVLRYLTREALDTVRDTDIGARAAQLVSRLAMPMLEVHAVLQAPLTAAEIDVLRLLREGLTREEMADRLFVSVNTVKTQLRSAYRKLGASGRAEALETFASLGI